MSIAGILDMLCAFAMAVGGIRASRRLHYSLVTAVVCAPYSFFCVTPRGRLINRFSEDIANIDFVMPFTVRSMMNTILGAFASIFVITYATPLFLISVPPFAIIYLIIQVYCGFINLSNS